MPLGTNLAGESRPNASFPQLTGMQAMIKRHHHQARAQVAILKAAMEAAM
jgi:hypothetical protein